MYIEKEAKALQLELQLNTIQSKQMGKKANRIRKEF